jgi:ATP-dependent protease ClpP protease subunit
MLYGTYEDMKQEIKNMDFLMEHMLEIYKEHTRIPEELYQQILKQDVYLDAKQCLEYGIIDEVLS